MNKNIILLSTLALALSSCSDWLEEPTPGVTKLEDYFTGVETAVENVNACYVPLAWELNETYFSEWFIGDVVSDDALKGGQNTNDMADVYDMENWKTMSNNGLLKQYYRAQYMGIGRCNLAIQYIEQMPTDATFDLKTKQRILGEAHFLRAYYYFRMLRVFGGVPLVTKVIDSDEKWLQKRATTDEIYTQIKTDLMTAESYLPHKSEYTTEDLGRATKGAAQAMLLKTNLYTKDYDEAKRWGEKIINSGEYDLCADYRDNFTLEGENGIESVWEIQYTEEETSDYGEGFGFTRGTFSVILTRSRSSILGGGWGFNHPTQNLYDEYEEGDPRREATILVPTDDQIQNPSQEIYLGNRYLNRKYAIVENDENTQFYTLAHDSRGPINNKQIRYADVLLMYAEACAELGADDEAITSLNKVRERVSMPLYPNYDIAINGKTITPDLRSAIRHERRIELAMEGHRWFDLCRWGIAKETMDAYKATETAECQSQMAEFIKGKHELFPIPFDEIDLNPSLEQNAMY